MINLELYKIFYVVAQEKSITKASKKLMISQPAITKHIHNLEESIKTPLFIRTKKGVILNEYGNALFLKVRQALTIIESAEEEIMDKSNKYKGTIKIGISTLLAQKYLLKFIEEFHHKYKDIVIDIRTDPTASLITQLKNGEIDFIIGKYRPNLDKDLTYDNLSKTEYVFITNPKHIEVPKNMKAKDLEDYPILLQATPSNTRESAIEYFKNNNLNIEPKMNIASSNLLINFVKIGYGIGYTTKLFIEDELKNETLKIIDINPKPDAIEFGIIKLKNNVLTSSCLEFLNFLKK